MNYLTLSELLIGAENTACVWGLSIYYCILLLQSPSKHDSVIKSLEKELGYYKEECASLQEMVKKKLVDSVQASPKKKGKVGNERQ